MEVRVENKIRGDFQHDKQRRMHPQDRHKGRNHKVCGRHELSCQVCFICKRYRRPGRQLRTLNHDDLDPNMPHSKELTREAWRDVYRGYDDMAKPAVLRPIALADIAQPSRRQPKHNFEVIPRPRNVIALDEDYADADDEWDRIDKTEVWGGNNRTTRPRVSYAAVVTKRGGSKKRAK